MRIVSAESAGWAGWYWITLEDGSRRSVTVREILAVDEDFYHYGEWECV